MPLGNFNKLSTEIHMNLHYSIEYGKMDTSSSCEADMNVKEKAFHDLFSEYYTELLAYCIARLHNVHDAHDAASEAFHRLWAVWDTNWQFPPAGNKSWLMKAAQLIIKESIRRHMRDDTEDIEEFTPFLSDEDLIDRKTESIQYAYYIEQIKSQLNENERKVFQWIVEQELSYKEIAKRLEVQETTLRSLIYRMRKKIKPIIKKNLK